MPGSCCFGSFGYRFGSCHFPTAVSQMPLIKKKKKCKLADLNATPHSSSNTVEQGFSKFNVHTNHPGGDFVKMQIPIQEGLGWGLILYISNSSQVMLMPLAQVARISTFDPGDLLINTDVGISPQITYIRISGWQDLGISPF